MIIENLYLRNFRNYKECEISFDPFMNIFIGKNAQGKTNILEAIYLLSITKSFRTHILKELIYFGEDFSRLRMNLLSSKDHISLEIIISKLGKKALINNKEIHKSSEYVGYLNVVLFTPDDLQLIKGSPKKRRSFLDLEISKISPIYLFNLNKYKKLLKERNEYLKLLHDSKKNEDEYLEVLSEQLAKLSVDLIKKRIEFISLLNELAQEVYKYVSDGKEELNISYKCSYKEIEYEYILSKYKDHYSKDIFYSTTNIGIHKDDLKIELDGKDASLYASQGQQRSIVLSIKIGLLELIKREIGEYPILLLDDVLSELDDERRVRMLNLISNKVQTFITTTSIEGLNHEIINRSRKIYIEEGMVKGVNDGRKSSS